jgi:DNA-binding CsgD family transcriptional regulator
MTRTGFLWALFTLQALCCGYFLLDIAFDFLRPANPSSTRGGLAGFADSDLVEAAVTLALFLGLAFTGSELYQLLRRQSHMSDLLKVASGAFSEVLEARFRDWGLTVAERDVAVLAIKGYAIADIAALRATKLGTVKAQCAAVYRKAEVSGRLELISLFLDDLIDEELIPAKAPST